MSAQEYMFYFDEPADSQIKFSNPWHNPLEIKGLYSNLMIRTNELEIDFRFDTDSHFDEHWNGLQFRSERIRFVSLEQAQGDYWWNIEKNHYFWENKIAQDICDFKYQEQSELKWKSDSSVYLSIKSESEIAPVYNKSGTIRNKLGRKPVWTGLYQRKYVVLKSLLRKIHSFFWKDIKNETNYLKK